MILIIPGREEDHFRKNKAEKTADLIKIVTMRNKGQENRLARFSYLS